MLIWAHSWTYCTCVFLHFAIVKQTDRRIVNRHPKKTCRYHRLIVFLFENEGSNCQTKNEKWSSIWNEGVNGNHHKAKTINLRKKCRWCQRLIVVECYLFSRLFAWVKWMQKTILCLVEELVSKVMLGSTAWWLDCALKCVKKSGVCMVVRLCIEMHSLLCGIKYQVILSEYGGLALWKSLTTRDQKSDGFSNCPELTQLTYCCWLAMVLCVLGNLENSSHPEAKPKATLHQQ